MKLLLDLGNTRLKWALQQAGQWVTHGAVGWDDNFDAALASALANIPSPTRVVAASVVSMTREISIATAVKRLCGLDVEWRRTPANACGVRNAYAEPARLGVDRFLAMVAAHADSTGPCVLAGLGTALTLDALAADGRHLGGLIAPGPPLMQQSLLGATAQVQVGETGKITELADNTTDAVLSGCWLAAVALIERFVQHAAPLLGAAPALYLSGGDAARLLPQLSLPAQLTHNAVLRGLAVWADTE